MTDNYAEQVHTSTDDQMAAGATQVAAQQASRFNERKLQNPNFLNELRDPDVDSDVFDWIETEYPTWFSGLRAVTNRPEDWYDTADLSMQNKRERAVAESKPGRLLRDRPYLLAIAQGVHSPDDEKFRNPIRSPGRRAIYGAAEVAADMMSLSAGAAGLNATTTATTETRVTRDREENKTASRLGRVFE